jgi:hypothetical protein
VAEEFLKEVLKPLEDRRGDETTRRGNDIVAQECKKVLDEEFPDLVGKIQHIGGATKDGEKEKYLEEINVRKDDSSSYKGSRFPDLTWGENPDDKRNRNNTHANTVSIGKDGEPTSKEEAALRDIRAWMGKDLITHIPKLRPGMDEEAYRERARETCREIFTKWRNHMAKGKGGEDVAPEEETEEE